MAYNDLLGRHLTEATMESIERVQNTDTIELLKTTTDALIRKCEALRDECEALRDDRDEAQRLHQELLFEVATKHPRESRHETALRYIRQAETHSNTQCEENGNVA